MWTNQPDDGIIELSNSISLDRFYNILICGELFGTDLDQIFDPDGARRSLTTETRLEHLKYSVPDAVCFDHQFDAQNVTGSNGTIDPRHLVRPIGPYRDLSVDDL
jgi:hypothetical protein